MTEPNHCFTCVGSTFSYRTNNVLYDARLKALPVVRIHAVGVVELKLLGGGHLLLWPVVALSGDARPVTVQRGGTSVLSAAARATRTMPQWRKRRRAVAAGTLTNRQLFYVRQHHCRLPCLFDCTARTTSTYCTTSKLHESLTHRSRRPPPNTQNTVTVSEATLAHV